MFAPLASIESGFRLLFCCGFCLQHHTIYLLAARSSQSSPFTVPTNFFIYRCCFGYVCVVTFFFSRPSRRFARRRSASGGISRYSCWKTFRFRAIIFLRSPTFLLAAWFTVIPWIIIQWRYGRVQQFDFCLFCCCTFAWMAFTSQQNNIEQENIRRKKCKKLLMPKRAVFFFSLVANDLTSTPEWREHEVQRVCWLIPSRTIMMIIYTWNKMLLTAHCLNDICTSQHFFA